MSDKDYYKILGVSESASTEEVKRAYRKLALKNHPDRVPTDKKKDAEARFKDISEAYYCLSDKNRRKEYDAYRRGGPRQFQGNFAQAQGFDFDEIVRHFGEFGYQKQKTKGRTAYGRTFDIDDIFDIFDHMGSGGTSKQHYEFNSGNFKDGYPSEEKADLHASLNIPAHLLSKGGEAKFKHHGKDITLKIKPGTRKGQRLRLKDQGNLCTCCHHRGDLIVTIS